MARSSPSQDVRYFRLAAMYRRCGIWALVGALLASGVAFWAGRFLNRNPFGSVALAAFFTVLATSVCFLVFHWRLRVDRHGIARRRLLRWDLWPWEAFEDGRIRRLTPDSYEWPARGRLLFETVLSFAFLSERDSKHLTELCERIRTPPAEPDVQPELEVPAELNLRLLFRKRLRLSASGIDLKVGRREYRYRWDELVELRIIRLLHERRDFVRLEVVLADRTIRLYVSGRSKQWKGPDPEVVLALLRRHVPGQRTLVASSLDRPQSVREADYRLNEVKQKLRELRGAVLVFGPFLAGMLLWMLLFDARPIAFRLLYVCIIAFLSWQVFRFHANVHKDRQGKLERWRAEICSEAGEDSDEAGC